MKALKLMCLFTDVFRCMTWSLASRGFLQQAGGLRALEPEKFCWRLGDCQCHDEVKDEFEKEEG